MEDLTQLRAELDDIDSRLLDLFGRRMDCAERVAEYKRAEGLPVLDRARERAKLNAIYGAAPDELKDYSTLLFSTLLELSRARQYSLLGSTDDTLERIQAAVDTTEQLFPRSASVACQGVEGAYSQMAADKLFKRPSIEYHRTFEGVFRAVDEGRVRYGVLPVENSTAGTVGAVYDLMMRHDFHIVRTCRVKVAHVLLGNHGATLEKVHEVYSHSQAIRQCSEFLDSRHDINVHVVENTALAAQMVAKSGRTDVAALSSRSCADLYGLDVIDKDIQNKQSNVTRFACISKNLEIYPGADRTSLMMVTSNDPGSLYKVLARFYALDINLVKLQSRPIPDRDFEFMFYFDVQSPVVAPEFQTLMSSLGDVCEEYRYLGSYSEAL